MVGFFYKKKKKKRKRKKGGLLSTNILKSKNQPNISQIFIGGPKEKKNPKNPNKSCAVESYRIGSKSGF